MKKVIIVAALALTGIGAAVAVAAGTAPTTGTQTFTNVVTYTIPTVTETVTVTTTVGGTTTAPATTGTTTSSPPPPANSYEQAISYTQTPPIFVPIRTVNVTTAAQLKTAISELQAGDLVKATAPFTVSSSSGSALTITNRPSSTAELDLTGVTFIYTGGQNVDTVHIGNAANLNIFGGDISDNGTGGTCLRDYGSQHVLWWGWSVHDCGGTGFQPQSVGAAVDHDDFQGTITRAGENLAWDPHSEKGTGIHGANLWDNTGTFPFSNNRFALDETNIPAGACIEWGNDTGTAPGNVLYLRCLHETEVSKVMTGGNGIQFWGAANGTTGLDIKYIECQDLQGACVYSIANSSGVTVDYGRASNTNQNPQVTGGVWNKTRGIVYKDVQPTP